MIIPYTIQKKEHDECLFIRIKILCEGGKIFWNEEIDQQTVKEILSESEFQNIIFRGGLTKTLPKTQFFKIDENPSIPDYKELPNDNMDLCWRTFYLILKKSCENPSNYFFYLPCPTYTYMGVDFIENIFQYILKVEFDINIEL
ncbi:MAG: hypothetical protein EBT86_07110 [Actinobacteria bacterium]|nr:hypothetical protein [Actinomycetota bacterium]